MTQELVGRGTRAQHEAHSRLVWASLLVLHNPTLNVRHLELKIMKLNKENRTEQKNKIEKKKELRHLCCVLFNVVTQILCDYLFRVVVWESFATNTFFVTRNLVQST